MKKNLFFAALAVVAMASCSKNEAVDPISASDASQSIAFDSFIDRTTKGAVADISTLEAGGFNVVCYDTEANSYAAASQVKNVMNDLEVTYDVDNSTWTYNSGTYTKWPEDSYLSFFAYANAGDSDAITSTTSTDAADKVAPTLDVTTDHSIDDQTDILAAISLDNAYQASTSPINLNFDHILTKIGFSAQDGNEADNISISIDEVTVEFIDNNDDAGIKDSGTYDFVSGTWSFATPYVGSYLDSGDTAETIFSVADYLLSKTSAKEITSSYIMIIPQELKSANAVKITVTYDVADTNDTDTASDQTKSVYLPAYTFEQGKWYTFNLIVGNDTIRFGTITTNEWNPTSAPQM